MKARKALVSLLLLLVCIAVPFQLWRQGHSRLNYGKEKLSREASELKDLAAEHERLAKLVAEADNHQLKGDPLRELLRLRGEMGRLRLGSNELVWLKAQNRRLRNPTEEAPDPSTVLANWPKAGLAPAGCAEPLTALKTTLWAITRGDSQALSASATTNANSNLLRYYEEGQGSKAEALDKATRVMTESFAATSAFVITSQTIVPQNIQFHEPEKAELEVYFAGENVSRIFTFHHWNNEWKFNYLNNGSWP